VVTDDGVLSTTGFLRDGVGNLDGRLLQDESDAIRADAVLIPANSAPDSAQNRQVVPMQTGR